MTLPEPSWPSVRPALLASEAALTLPDNIDNPVTVAAFQAAHRGPIIVLQVIGFVAAGVLTAYSLRLRSAYPSPGLDWCCDGRAGLRPGLTTIITSQPRPVLARRRWRLEPARSTADDLLFIECLPSGRRSRPGSPPTPIVRLVGAATCSAARPLTEAAEKSPGVLDALAPIAFIGLVDPLGLLNARAAQPVQPPTSAPQ